MTSKNVYDVFQSLELKGRQLNFQHDRNIVITGNGFITEKNLDDGYFRFTGTMGPVEMGIEIGNFQPLSRIHEMARRGENLSEVFEDYIVQTCVPSPFIK